MTRIYSITYAVHLAFQPDAVDAGTKTEPDRKLEQPPVDTWATRTRTVAVVDGWAEDAIKKLRGLLEEGDADVKEGRASEVQIVAVSLQSEAE